MQTHTTETRKPAFRWLGMKGKTWSESGDSVQNSNHNESRKRMFGDDVTNISFKRNKVDLFMNGDSSKNSKMPDQLENDSWRAHPDNSNAKEDAKQTSKTYQFGPFAPSYVPKAGGASENSSVKQVHDWESLSTAHRPQYQNQGNISSLPYIVNMEFCPVYGSFWTAKYKYFFRCPLYNLLGKLYFFGSYFWFL